MNRPLSLRIPGSKARATRAAATKAKGLRRKADGCTNAATSEIDYAPEVLEFIRAIERFKSKTGRRYPAWSEVFNVFRSLGYSKR